MEKYEQIAAAMNMFDINELDTISAIKKKIAARLKQWHPDTAGKDQKDAKEKSISLIAAKKLIMDYIDNYRISFKKEEIAKHLSPEEFWMRQFGNDPMWGNGK
jgi:hypothetical protein